MKMTLDGNAARRAIGARPWLIPGAAASMLCCMLVASAARAEINPASLPGCETPPPPATLAETSATLTIDSATGWQPRRGEVLFTISAAGRPDRVRVCLRWRSAADPDKNTRPFMPSPSVRVLEATPDGKLKLGAIVPDLPLAEEGIERTASNLIPVADFRVIAGGGDLKAPIDIVERVGVTSKTFSGFVGFGSAAAALAIIGLVKTRSNRRDFSLFRIVATSQGGASISQFQIVLWTCVIGASAAYVMTLSGTLIEISDGTLALLGISGVSVFGAALKGRIDQAKGVRGPAAKGWEALVKDGDEIDPTRLQMLFFTLLTAAFVILKVINGFRIPEIPGSYQVLMGMSNGIYLGAKYIKPGDGNAGTKSKPKADAD
jgi:hypothetical protein